jgi:hypothetical protein
VHNPLAIDCTLPFMQLLEVNLRHFECGSLTLSYLYLR